MLNNKRKCVIHEISYFKYLLLTKFEVCTVSCRLSFRLMVQAQSMQTINLNRKKTQGCVIYGIDQENKVSKGRRFQSKETF